jgi:hypothetical protein
MDLFASALRNNGVDVKAKADHLRACHICKGPCKAPPKPPQPPPKTPPKPPKTHLEFRSRWSGKSGVLGLWYVVELSRPALEVQRSLAYHRTNAACQVYRQFV